MYNEYILDKRNGVPKLMARVNFLNNKDMLEEIHKSKSSYCEFTNPGDDRYDYILDLVSSMTKPSAIDINDIFKADIIEEAKANRAARLSDIAFKEAQKKSTTKLKASAFAIDPKDINIDDLVFRVMTYEHIPLENRKKNPKRVADYHVKLNFLPFIHYKIANLNLKIGLEVGRSHSKNGEFSLTHGSITNTLANMYLLLVERYAQKVNWRNYTYVEEMQGQSLIQLTQMGLLFNELKSDNPFSYFTALMSNSFTKIVNSEKAHQSLRDDLLQEAGMNPSFTRQMEHEEEVRKSRESLNSEDI